MLVEHHIHDTEVQFLHLVLVQVERVRVASSHLIVPKGLGSKMS